jgi:hypothetical protein
MVLFQNCVRQSCSPTKMATTVQLRCYWKQLWSRWATCFLSETLIYIASPIIFLFIHNHLTLRKWCYTQLQHDFALDPIISPFDFHFRTYKRNLAIQTEWWELLNAACQIICICKQQHTNHMEDDIKRILQDKQFHLQLKSEQKEII